MKHPDAYLTLNGSSKGDFRDRGSKFPSLLFPCNDESELKAEIERLKKEHPTARHFCYGAVFDSFGEDVRSNDDGEPSGTAGLPILNQLLSAELRRVACVVVRYFGGTKLGKPGLIQAYKGSAQEAISNARPLQRYRCEGIRIDFAYDATGPVMRAIEQFAYHEILHQEFDQRSHLEVLVPVSEVDKALHLFDHTDEVSISPLDRKQ